MILKFGDRAGMKILYGEYGEEARVTRYIVTRVGINPSTLIFDDFMIGRFVGTFIL